MPLTILKNMKQPPISPPERLRRVQGIGLDPFQTHRLLAANHVVGEVFCLYVSYRYDLRHYLPTDRSRLRAGHGSNIRRCDQLGEGSQRFGRYTHHYRRLLQESSHQLIFL